MSILDDIYNALSNRFGPNSYGLTLLNGLISNLGDAIDDCEDPGSVSAAEAAFADAKSISNSIVTIAGVNDGRADDEQGIVDGISPSLQMIGCTGSEFTADQTNTIEGKVDDYSDITDEAQSNVTALTNALNGNFYEQSGDIYVDPQSGPSATVSAFIATQQIQMNICTIAHAEAALHNSLMENTTRAATGY